MILIYEKNLTNFFFITFIELSITIESSIKVSADYV